MEDVTAIKLHAGALAQTVSIADNAIVVCLHALSEVLVPVHACFIQAWQAFPLVLESAARMPASQHLVATLVHRLNAGLLSADGPKSRLYRWGCACDLGHTEPALAGFLVLLVLFACFASVVRLCLALAAEVFLALTTPDSILAHVNSRISRNELACVVLNLVVNLSLNHFHDVPTAAVHHAGVMGKKLRLFEFRQFFHKRSAKKLPYFLL